MNKMRAVLYARTSKDDSERGSLDGQIDQCRQYAKDRGYQIVAEVRDDGLSGADIDLPGLNRVQELAVSGGFDVLVTRELDRLSRSLVKQLLVERDLKMHGVAIEYVLGEYPDTPEGRLNKNIRATIAEFERELLARRMTRGRINRVRSGGVMVHSRPPYGYDVVRGADGLQRLVINPEQAEVVKNVFTWYRDGMNIEAIARRLENDKVPSAADIHGWHKKRARFTWGRGVVSQMLKNETYIGRWRYRAAGEDLLVEVPAIVTEAEFDAARARLEVNKRMSKRNRKYHYLLAGHVVCGHCGLRMIGRATHKGKYKYYYCPATMRRDSARDCNLPHIRADRVDEEVWSWVKDLLTDPDAIERGLSELRAKQDQGQQLRELDKRIAAQSRKLDRLVDLYVDGDLGKQRFARKKTDLENAIEAFEAERDRLLAAQRLTREQIDNAQTFTAQVADGLSRAEGDFEKRRQLLDILSVEVALSVQDGQKVADMRCLLGMKDFVV